MSERVKVAKGLAGVSITDTKIGKSDPDGSLVYRGYPIAELTDNASFEEVAYLVTRGSLPKSGELQDFSDDLRSKMTVPSGLFRIMKDLGQNAHPIDALRTANSALGSIDHEPTTQGQQTSIESKMSVLAANCYRVPRGQEPRTTDGSGSFTQDLLLMLTEKEHTEFERWVFERVMILYMEHDLNASSFTVRVVASTRADPYAAVSAGLASLKGPLHGGANESAMDMLIDVGDPDKVPSYLDQELGRGRKISGFGHRVYKRFDPRAVILKQHLKDLCQKQGGDDRLYLLCDRFESEMKERKNLPANLDFYAAPIFFKLGIDIPLYTPIFAASRVFGWMAHYNEQIEDNKLIRPDAIYVGPTDLKYVDIGRR